jgi:hypothetical protein
MADSGAKTPVTAPGGSARSEVAGIDSRRWKPRRGLALVVRAVVVVVPLLGSIVAVEAATRVVSRPATVLPFVAWLVGLMVLATIALRLVDRQLRRLLPLASILRLSLVFPDHAPSRFSIALRTGSGRALERAVANADAQHEFATPQETAEAVVSLLGAVSRHDRLTRGHCERVRAYADLIGTQLRLDAESSARLHWAALLHDIGKLDVPAEILNKKGRLTPEEWEQVRAHPGAADKWLAGLRPWLGDWSRAASEHHERFDGDGYPHGLAGEEISLAGRIVAVADAFDVMTAARSYKKPFPAPQARVELADNAGTQFDPDVVRAFLAISLGDLRRVTGPIAWLATVPAILRVGITGTVAPARTAVTAAGLAAASLVPGVIAPAPVPPPMESTFVAAGVADAAESSPPTTPSRRRTPTDSLARAAATPTASGAPAPGDAAVPGAAPASAAAPAAGATPPPGSDGGSSGGGGGNSGPGGGGGSSGHGGGGSTTTSTTTTSTTTTSTTQPPAHAPVARNDSPAPILLTSHVVIDVLANDSDVDGNIVPATLRIVSRSAGAAAQQITVVGGRLDVVPKTLVVGPMSVVYEICDSTSLCATAKVTITIVAAL